VSTPHASRLATQWLTDADPAPWSELHGTAVLADLTGFTRLTEALVGRGAEGVEVLHRALTLCFSALLDPCFAAGGDLIGLAGDAALVWFDGDGHEARAVDAALGMPAGLARIPAAVTGGKRLRVSTGVASGSVTAMLVGSTQRSVMLCGPLVTELVALEAAAAAGQVVAGRSVVAALPGAGWGDAVGSGVEVRRRHRTERPSGSIVAPALPGMGAELQAAEGRTAEASALAQSLLAPALRVAPGSEPFAEDHRVASVGFLAVPGIDVLLANDGPAAAHRVLDHVVSVVNRVAADHGVTWLDTDVDAGGVKLLLASGVPRAVDDDEMRLVRALRQILDEAGVPLRAGAQRGAVFAGSLGVPGRATYTVLGDTVNVAARAMRLADDRQLVVGDEMGVARRPDVVALALGPTALKNRVRPVEMWRVDEVRHGARPAAAPHVSFGREAEREIIRESWKAAFEGRGCVVQVVGEPGMGTSELLGEAADRAGGHGTFLVADPARRDIPHDTIRSVVRSLAGAAGSDDPWAWLEGHAQHLGDDGEHGALVRTWLPDGRRAIVGDGADATEEPADPAATGRRTRAVLAALVSAAAPRPWLLAVDDLDDVDDASRGVLRELAASAAAHPWVLLLGVRTATPPGSAVPGEPITLVLEPLDEAAATALAVDVAPELRDDQVARLVGAARGNPLVLVELARHPSSDELPDSLERLGAARVDALEPEVRALVRDVSTFGTVVPMAVAAEILGRPELADPAAWAVAGPILRPGEIGTVVFRHDAYRLAAHGALTFQRRRALHGAIADLLAAGDRADAELARHLELAGRAREAFPLAVSAARAAAATGSLVEASDLFGMAVRLGRSVDRTALGPLLVDQADCLARLGDLTGADKAFTAAGRLVDDPLAYAALCGHRAELEIRRERHRQARSWVQKGLSLVSHSAVAAEVRGRLLLHDATALHFLGRDAESLAIATESLRLALLAGSRALEGLAHLNLEMIHATLLHPEAAEHGDAAVAIFTEIGDDANLGKALINSGLTEMHAGRWDEALDRYRRGAEVEARLGDTTRVAIVRLNEGFLLVRQGRFDEADELGRLAQRTFDTVGLPLLGAYTRLLRSQAAAGLGHLDEAEGQLNDAREIFVALSDRTMVVDCDAVRIEQLLAADRAADARAYAESVGGRVDGADEATVVMLRRSQGLAEAATGDAMAGVARIGAALDSARRLSLVFEEHQCLAALVSIERGGGPAAPPGAAERRRELAAQLGLSGAA
jgi:class 3 adenylate cyclase/tetratricopeptide (TPR) repeat protein